MPTETSNMIMSALTRIEAKQDIQSAEMGRVNERLTRLEVRMDAYSKQQDQQGSKLEELETLKNRGMGAKQVAAWIVTTAIAIVGFFR